MNAAPEARPPPLIYALGEGARFVVEINQLLLFNRLLRRIPQGDQHPVMVLPGFLASDGSTAILRHYISHWGYDTHGWGRGRNLGIPADSAELEGQLQQRMGAIVRRHGRRISLVGWSLGGVLARELARASPAHVRQVITLGSPIGGNPRATSISRLYEMVSGTNLDSEDLEQRIASMAEPVPGVPCTSIYSNSDGIVAASTARERETAITENIRIVASHIGLGFSAAALYAIADRLAQTEDQWQHFHLRGWRRMVYAR